MTIEVIEISHMFQGRIQQPCSTVVARIFRRRRSFSSSSRCYSRRFSGDRDVLITLWACSSNGANSLHSRGEWNARKFRRIRSNCLSRPICRALQGTDALSHSKSIFTPKADKQQPAESIPTRDTKKEDSKKSAKTFSTVYADYYKTERERGRKREREKRLCWNHCFTRDVVKGSDCSTKDFPPPFVSFLFQYIELHKWKREISPWQTTKFSPLSWTFVDPVYRAQGSPISSTISYVNFHEYFCVWRFERFALNAARYQERILHCLLLGRSLGSHVKIGNVSLWVHTAHEHYQNEIKINRTWIIVIWNSFKQINISIFFSERKSRLFPFLPTNNSIKKEKKKKRNKRKWFDLSQLKRRESNRVYFFETEKVLGINSDLELFIRMEHAWYTNRAKNRRVRVILFIAVILVSSNVIACPALFNPQHGIVALAYLLFKCFVLFGVSYSTRW